MPSNVEIKARVDNHQVVAQRAEELSGEPGVVASQRDVFFNAPRGRFKLRHFEDGTGELIYYERPDKAGPAMSRYQCVPIARPAALQELLASCCGVRATVCKRRRIYLAGQTRIHLDRVEGLGDFVELEVVLRDGQTADEGAAIARRTMGSLGLAPSEWIDVAYVDLLAGSA